MHDGKNDEAGHPEIAGVDVSCGIHRRCHAGDKKKRRHEGSGENHPCDASFRHCPAVPFFSSVRLVRGNLNLKNR